MKLLVSFLLLAAAISFPAQAGIFLDIRDIPGESTAQNHEGQIDILTWSQSVANVNSMPVVLPLVVTHSIDKATPKLIEAALLGSNLEQAILAVSAPNPSGPPFDYIVLTLLQPRIVSVQSGGVTGDQPVETVTLTCASFRLEYTKIEPDGSAGPVTDVEGGCGN